MAVSSTTDGEAFVRAVPEELAALAEMIAQQQPDLLPLDRSYASLDRVEDFYQACLEEATGASASLESRLACYVGATLAASTGGRWEPPRTKSDLGRASIVGLPYLARAKFYPLDVVRNFKRTRSAGYLRDATEIYDIPVRRALLAHLVANSDAKLAALHFDLRDLLGRDPGALDGSADSLAVIEAALKQLLAANAPRDLLRRIETGAVLYLGQIVQRAVGGEWTLCEDPDDADLGQLQMHGWAPITVIRNVGPNSRPNLLQTVLDLVIKARSNK